MRFEREIQLSAPPEAVWNVLADTDRLNREIGLPPIHFDFTPRPAGGTEVTAAITICGVTLRYREHPFEWVRPRWYNVRRTFFGGPIKEIWGGIELREISAGTSVVVFAEVHPRNVLGRPICSAIGRKSIADMSSGCKRFEAYFRATAATPFPRHSRKPAADLERLGQALGSLLEAGADDDLSRRLTAFLASAPPEDLTTIRPFELADKWGRDRRAVLETCLLATRRRLLDLHWRVLCPFCRGGPPGVGKLEELAATVHCETCNIRFDAEFDRSVEVCFSVAPSIRPVHLTTYCIGGPRISPHVGAQFVLEPNTRRQVALTGISGGFEIASLQTADRSAIDVRESDSGRSVRINKEGNLSRLVVGDTVTSADKWTLENETDETVVLRLESPVWRSDTATAALVTSLPAFRDQFSSEVLSPHTELAVRQICILFTDLVGSTGMYQRLGDAPSYRPVRYHFDFIPRIIASHDGSVVKTAGDAVMACFHDPADGLAASVEIQRKACADGSQLMIKLGLHWGPALVVNANGQLDYFGHTVNMASRLQHQSAGGEIVISEEVMEDSRVTALLSQPGTRASPFEAVIRGVGDRLGMVRVFVE